MSIECNFIITGASGWIGRELMEFLYQKYGNNVIKHLYPVSRVDKINCSFGDIKTYNYEKIKNLNNVMLYHLAFVAKEQLTQMDVNEYKKQNLDIRKKVENLILTNNIKKMFYSSSGAVYKRGTDILVDDEKNIYGWLKKEDEIFFQALCKKFHIKLLVCRIFALIGKYININSNYALIDMIKQAKNSNQISIQANNLTYRNYIDIQDLLNIVNSWLTDVNSYTYYCFDSFGQTIEMKELAILILKCINKSINIVRKFDNNLSPDNYFGDSKKQENLMSVYNIKLSSLKNSIENLLFNAWMHI